MSGNVFPFHRLKALLFDLDDTILIDDGVSEKTWRSACDHFVSRLNDLNSEDLYIAIKKASAWFWSDRENHRRGRLNLRAARRQVVNMALTELGTASPDLANRLADRFTAEKEKAIAPFAGAIDVLRSCQDRGWRLALISNGAADAQRKKIQRFGLAGFFDYILIEGEFGTGKPEPIVFRTALDNLGVQADEVCMVGNDLVQDIEGAQKCGIFSVWVDVRGAGLPVKSAVKPDYIIRDIRQLFS